LVPHSKAETSCAVTLLGSKAVEILTKNNGIARSFSWLRDKLEHYRLKE